LSTRRCRLRRDIGAERRAPASGLSSTPDCGATSVWSAASRRAGTCLTPSIAARRRRRAPYAGGGEAQLDAIDCGATSARSAVSRRAGSARLCRLQGFAPCAMRRRAGSARTLSLGASPLSLVERRARSHSSSACSYSRVSLGAPLCSLALTQRAHSRSARARSHSSSACFQCSYSPVSLGARCPAALTRCKYPCWRAGPGAVAYRAFFAATVTGAGLAGAG